MIGQELTPVQYDDAIAGEPLSVEQCKRCGLGHANLPLRRYEPPIVVSVTPRIVVTDWTMCPVTDAPILVVVQGVPE